MNWQKKYRQTSSISGTESKNFNVFASGIAVVFAESIDARC